MLRRYVGCCLCSQLRVLTGNACPTQHTPLALPPLPYEYDALEPHMDGATMRVHHLGHHATYTAKLNDALAALWDSPTSR
jgi:hypothetical protein